MKEEQVLNKKISIIIPCYNCEEWIQRNINSLINQSVKNFEVIWIDDGSTDNSLNIAEYNLKFFSIIH